MMIQPAVTIDPSYLNCRRTVDVRPASHHNRRQIDRTNTTSTNLLTKASSASGTVDSWRWCSFICSAAIKCFGNNNINDTTTITTTSRNGSHQLTITPRKTYDGNLNVTYEL